MPRIKPSKKALICLVLVAVVFFLISGLTYFNRVSRLHDLQVKLYDKQEKLADSENMARKLEAVEARYLDAQSKLSVLEEGVSSRAYVPTLLRQLEELGKNVNLRVAGVRPMVENKRSVVRPAGNQEGEQAQAKAKKPEPYDKLDINIEINGKYWDVVRFLYEITSFPKIIAVREMQISPVGETREIASPVLSVKLSTTAFILKESAPRTARRAERQVSASGRRI